MVIAGRSLGDTSVIRSRLATRSPAMRKFTALIERDPETGYYVGYVPSLRAAYTQAETLDELQENLREVIELALEDGEPDVEGEFFGIQTVLVA
jgi:predicted RNase H-like HicB family nuclease